MIKMTPAELNNIKAQVKAEMLRRTRYANISGYGGTNWNITTAASTGKPIVKDQGDKIITPLLQIKDYGDLYNPVQGGPVPNSYNSKLSNYVRQLATEPVEGSSTNCRGACTGMCYGSCAAGCKGCTGSCSTSCNGCSGTCGTGCNGGAMGSNPKP